LIHNGQTVTDSTDIANSFNDYFSNIGSKLANSITPRNTNKSFHDYLGDPNQNCMFLFPATALELDKLLRNLESKKASGADCIPPKIVKICKDSLIDPLLKIINKSFSEGVFPDQLKIAKVIPIYKKNERDICGNYRPISLLSCFDKVIEKLMHKRLYSFLHKHDILYPYQFGFREGHSTSLALTEIMEKIHEHLDTGDSVIGIYLDLTKAFDTVQHDILLSKLSHYGVRGKAHNWFKSYLGDRKQFVQVNGVQSSQQYINTGVPQGSVLGPLLFLVYVNDIYNSVKDIDCKLLLFADDTNIFLVGKDIVILKAKAELALECLQTWFDINKLTLSLSKTLYNIFHNRNKAVPHSCNKLNVFNLEINRVPNAKFLGITIDEKLKWTEHITQLCQKLVKYASSFKIIKHHVHSKFKKQLFSAHIVSNIKYGIEVYGHTSLQNIRKIQVLQNRILKILFNEDWFTPTNSLHSKLKVLKISDIFKLQMAQFVFKCNHGDVPKVFDSYFTRNNQIHDHNTRNASKLHIAKYEKEAGKATAKVMGSLIYNSIPEEIKEQKSLKSFTKHYRAHLLDKYDG
jgi:hypothetical protein